MRCYMKSAKEMFEELGFFQRDKELGWLDE